MDLSIEHFIRDLSHDNAQSICLFATLRFAFFAWGLSRATCHSEVLALGLSTRNFRSGLLARGFVWDRSFGNCSLGLSSGNFLWDSERGNSSLGHCVGIFTWKRSR